MKNMVTILLLGVLMIGGAVSADVDTGLVAYYCFDDASNLGKDCSTNGNNGTVEGSVTASTGFAGGAASFGGYYNSGAIHVPNSSSLQFTGDFSVAHAVKLSGLDGMDGWGNYKSPLNYDAASPFFEVFMKGEGALSTMLTTDIRNESIYYYSSFNPSPSLIEGYSINEWANIVYVYSNSEHTAKVFINGRLVSTHDVSINITDVNSEDIYIGRNHSYWHPMNGAIDEMRIYNRALTDAEVLQLAAPNNSADSGSINVSDVLSSHGITDVLFNGSDVFVLATVKSPDGVYRVDPDGTRAYKSSLKIVRFNKDSNSYQSVVIGEVWPNGDPTSGHGALYLSGDYLYAFKNSKDDGNGYAQSGSIYKINVSDPAMISLESESKLFSASNWGWWPVFKSSSVLSHFSFAGYYRYENTSNLGSVLPSVMQQEYADAVAAHSQGLVLANEADTMGSSSRPNVISRIQALMGEQQTTFSLAIKKSGTGSGSVTSKDGKINCGTICAADFDNGSSVILTATPDTNSGSTFSGWSGACTNKTGDCTVKMSEAQTITANFNLLPSYKLSINKSGKGTVTSEPVGINCGTACSKTFTSGTAVTLTAKADTGATFTKWTGCTPVANKPLQCTVTLTSNNSVTATFTTTSTTYSLAIIKVGNGTVTSAPAGINCGSVCNKSFTNGIPVTLTAKPATGSTFTGWSGAGCTGNGACVVMMSATKQVTANFAAITSTLTITNVSPKTTVVGSPTIFTVTGSNLVAGMGFTVGDCALSNKELGGGTKTKRQFVCTQYGDAGTKRGLVKTAPGGTILYNFSIQAGVDNIPEIYVATDKQKLISTDENLAVLLSVVAQDNIDTSLQYDLFVKFTLPNGDVLYDDGKKITSTKKPFLGASLQQRDWSELLQYSLLASAESGSYIASAELKLKSGQVLLSTSDAVFSYTPSATTFSYAQSATESKFVDLSQKTELPIVRRNLSGNAHSEEEVFTERSVGNTNVNPAVVLKYQKSMCALATKNPSRYQDKCQSATRSLLALQFGTKYFEKLGGVNEVKGAYSIFKKGEAIYNNIDKFKTILEGYQNHIDDGLASDQAILLVGVDIVKNIIELAPGNIGESLASIYGVALADLNDSLNGYFKALNQHDEAIAWWSGDGDHPIANRSKISFNVTDHCSYIFAGDCRTITELKLTPIFWLEKNTDGSIGHEYATAEGQPSITNNAINCHPPGGNSSTEESSWGWIDYYPDEDVNYGFYWATVKYKDGSIYRQIVSIDSASGTIKITTGKGE